jgi:diaminohydroxyphosphoribosylaminopyrimidine deaminase/5-amino-6-(5-phosphoribosylamino)uracil reductase
MDKIFYMRRALKLAKKGLGRTSPNPLVGAVIVKGGHIVGEGYHQRAGLPHAEVEAIKAAGQRTRGADLYVTLEPCHHRGRTPPCTEAILKAGIKQVFVGMRDPNPHVEGRGIEYLQSQGVKVETDILKQECLHLNEVFIKYVTKGLPFLSLKLAATLDGKIALARRETNWITNEKSRRFGHHLRDIHDAILVGINTIIKDDPLLTTRLPQKRRKDPLRFILDTHLRIPLEAKVLHLNSLSPTIIVTSFNASLEKIKSLQRLGAEVWQVETEKQRLSLLALLKKVVKKEITSVLIEGGAEVATSFLSNRLVDKVYFFYAPKIIGDGNLSMIGKLDFIFLKEDFFLKNLSLRRFGNDILISGYF